MTQAPSAPSGSLLDVKRDIESMRTRGAGEIGKQAAQALAAAAQSYTGRSLDELRRELLEAASLLASARPTAVTLRNGLNRILSALEGARDVADAQKRLAAAAQEYARHVEAAKQEIARRALSLFQPHDVILTHCHSTAAGGAIAHAAHQLAGIRVFATETRPFRQGIIQAPALAKEGVDVTLIVDGAVAHIFETEHVTRVVVGADTVAADGSLYNKIGTAQVARLAHDFGAPFIVCAEADKFSPYTLKGDPVTIEERALSEVADPATLAGAKIRNPVFDRTPPNLIQTYVTEYGLVEPAQVRSFMERQYQAVRQWI